VNKKRQRHRRTLIFFGVFAFDVCIIAPLICFVNTFRGFFLFLLFCTFYFSKKRNRISTFNNAQKRIIFPNNCLHFAAAYVIIKKIRLFGGMFYAG